MSQNPTGSAHLPTLLDPALSQGLLQGTILDSAVLSTPPGQVMRIAGAALTVVTVACLQDKSLSKEGGRDSGQAQYWC